MNTPAAEALTPIRLGRNASPPTTPFVPAVRQPSTPGAVPGVRTAAPPLAVGVRLFYGQCNQAALACQPYSGTIPAYFFSWRMWSPRGCLTRCRAAHKCYTLPMHDQGRIELLPFEEAVAVVLSRLRASLANLLASLPGRVVRAGDLRKILRLDYKLCWKATRVARAADPLAAAIHVPTPAGMRSLLEAAAASGVPAEVVGEVAAAAADFEELVSSHAGDRSSFDAMVSGFAGGTGAITLSQRRLSFRLNSCIWGAQARTQLKCGLFCPSGSPDRVDVAQLNGLIRLRQLRAGARLVVSRTRISDDKGEPIEGLVRQPLDVGGRTGAGVGLLEEFCSQPLPTIRWTEAGGGFVHGELEVAAVGNRGALTIVDGSFSPAAVPRYRAEFNWYNQLNARVHVPCEVLLVDLLIHCDTYEPGVVSPRVYVYGELFPGPPWPAPSRARDLLPITESVVYLGRGPSVMRTSDVPRYPEMIQYVLDRLGWAGEHFDVYRVRLAYPVTPTTVTLRFELPEPPR